MQSQCLVNVCGDVVLAVYGPETISVDETLTQPIATATSHVAAADSRMTSTATKSTELNVPEILVQSQSLFTSANAAADYDYDDGDVCDDDGDLCDQDVLLPDAFSEF